MTYATLTVRGFVLALLLGGCLQMTSPRVPAGAGRVVAKSRDSSTLVVGKRPSGRSFCSDAGYRDLAFVRDASRAEESHGASDGTLWVPVSIHLMDLFSGTRVKDYWTPDKLERFFGTGQWSINEIWRRAGIRFEVRLVERCLYDPPPPRTVNGGVVQVPDSAEMRHEPISEQRKRVDGYLATNLVYGTPRRLNIYLWGGISHGANAYGESPRRHRIEVVDGGIDALATVWVESGLPSCASEDPVKRWHCQLTIAHEVGHALGLQHTCLICTKECCLESCSESDGYLACSKFAPSAQGEEQKQRCPCGRTPGQETRDGLNLSGEAMGCCLASMQGRLMHPKEEGMRPKEKLAAPTLGEGEIHSARSAVREFFYYDTWRAK